MCFFRFRQQGAIHKYRRNEVSGDDYSVELRYCKQMLLKGSVF